MQQFLSKGSAHWSSNAQTFIQELAGTNLGCPHWEKLWVK